MGKLVTFVDHTFLCVPSSGMLLGAIESDEMRLQALTFLAESIALHPNRELRRAVLSELLIGVMAEGDDGRSGERVGDDVMRRLMAIIEGRRADDQSSEGQRRSRLMEIIMGHDQ